MYGAEHGFLLHAALMIGGWLVFLAICVAPFALVFLAYWLGVRRGRRLERSQLKNDDDRSPG
jgi:purine-cytosine permease-like protein